jgi:hypothetical protein
VVRQATHNYGKLAQVEVMPDSTMAYDHIHFGLQQLINHEQFSMLFDRDSNYQADVSKLRKEVLYKVSEIVDQIIIENESKVG